MSRLVGFNHGRTQETLKGEGFQFFKNQPEPNCSSFISTNNENARYYSKIGFRGNSRFLLHLFIQKSCL